jgi:uncharacterized protein (TIGR00251 family)
MVLEVKVKPNAHASTLAQLEDGSWVARLAAPPVDGRANAELIGLVAAHFHVPKSAVAIRRGASGRRKLVVVDP